MMPVEVAIFMTVIVGAFRGRWTLTDKGNVAPLFKGTATALQIER
jgi:hypothetical protein